MEEHLAPVRLSQPLLKALNTWPVGLERHQGGTGLRWPHPFPCICLWAASVLNPDPTAGPSGSTPYRDSEGVGLREEQVPSLEVIVEVEESTGKERRQEAVRRPHRDPGLQQDSLWAFVQLPACPQGDHPPIVSIGVGWGLPPAFTSIRVQDTVVCMYRVTQVHALLLLT